MRNPVADVRLPKRTEVKTVTNDEVYEGQRHHGDKTHYVGDDCPAVVAHPKPTVVTLCGSTRFKEAFEQAQLYETLSGRIVLTVGGYLHRDDHVAKLMERDGNKARVDELHLRKIDLSDEILVLNVDDYIGRSTRREIAYAQEHGKRIRWLYPHGGKG